MCRMAAAAGCIVFVNVHLERTVERLSACDSAGLPCEVRESLRQVEKAQGEVRKPKCQKKEG